MSGRGIPMASNRDDALRAGIRLAHRFKGNPPLPAPQREFARDLVIDVLPSAPQPVSSAWVRHTLAAVGTFTRWVVMDGLPLDRDVVLTEEVITRWVHVGLADRTNGTRSTYQTRLEIIRCHYRGIEWVGSRYPTIGKDDPGMPLTPQAEADLWLWSTNLRRVTWRQRVGASLALTLGCGLTRYEQGRVAREDVTRDDHGVHVTVASVRADIPPRVVTCRRSWETRLAALTLATEPGHLIASPWRTIPQTDAGFDQMFATVNRQSPPPARWNHQRLRNTWFARHLTVGTPIPVLLAAGGVTSLQTLTRLLPLLPDVDSHAAATWLRDAP
ncbi:hypothetical protein EU513_02290 [Yimella sp. RIT 621]|uniref:hypothetical protein n=1 Tax=Yimella sp. RIT 621 TaxID=2510323 RepID=UPI00101E08F5|nr:hypothetical protein [Yimella sp. RIT 621]RYG78460.1 hypothetical protein EU513_02290 [Yimella sp. RIT 621]